MKSTASDKLLIVLAVAASAALLAAIIYGSRSIGQSSNEQTSPAVIKMEEVAPDAPPPVLLTLPDFTLTERTGQSVSLGDLAGNVWVANFVFTRCAGPCPMVTATMAQLQRRYMTWPQWQDMRLVTISVDSVNDTPEVLAAYAKSFDAGAQWLFLTGARDAVWPLVAGGFKLTVGDDEDNAASPIMHSTKFVLVDGQGQIRGYYDRDDEEDLQRLDRHLKHVLSETAGASGATGAADSTTDKALPTPTGTGTP